MRINWILLSYIKAITGMEDIAMCMDILEQKEWNLVVSESPDGIGTEFIIGCCLVARQH